PSGLDCQLGRLPKAIGCTIHSSTERLVARREKRPAGSVTMRMRGGTLTSGQGVGEMTAYTHHCDDSRRHAPAEWLVRHIVGRRSPGLEGRRRYAQHELARPRRVLLALWQSGSRPPYLNPWASG